MSQDAVQLPVGTSEWDVEIFDYLSTHAKREGHLLEEYVTAAAHTESKALAYVINLLVEDERRHHRLFAELAATLRHESSLDPDDPVVPRLDFDRANRDETLEVTRRLIANEEHDAEDLKRLRKDLRDMEDTSLWALLVDTMRLDTEKHLTMLRFIERNARKNAR